MDSVTRYITKSFSVVLCGRFNLNERRKIETLKYVTARVNCLSVVA